MIPRMTGSIVKYPARILLVWYGMLILLGTACLMHPICRRPDAPPIEPMDALFTAASATSVTGLAVRSTEYDFSIYGQMVILVLIQVGGIGIMTITTYAMFRLGSRESLRTRALVAETLGADNKADLRAVLRHVLFMTALLETAGFLVLAARNLLLEPSPTALWNALFHSISAFCNAGFSVHDDSLVRYQSDPVVNFVIGSLVICGGIGFPVIWDVRHKAKYGWVEGWRRLHLHSKFMLLGTVLLLGFGAVMFLVLEWNGVLAEMPLWQRPMVALFHSTMCRTAGFNTIDVASLSNAMLFITILLMLVGAGPCSTAGGLKVSTLMAMMAHAWKSFLGQTRVNVFGRTIPTELVRRATATATLFTVVAMIALTVLLVCEQSTVPHTQSDVLFLDALFEVVSALGTVGLSVGLTGDLTVGGQLVIIALMFMGRLGPISVFAALSRQTRSIPVEYPAEEPLVG